MDASALRNSDENVRIQALLDRKARRNLILSRLIPYAGLVFILVFFIIVTNGKFIGADNLGNLVNQGFVLSIIAVGATFVYAHGGMDFSIAAIGGVAQLVCALMLVRGLPVPVAFVLCILTAVGGELIVSLISVVLRVPVFIGSMCVRTAFMGILAVATEKGTIAVDYATYKFMNSTPLKAITLLAFIALGFYLFNCTAFGKYNKAIGGNRTTAVQAGIRDKKIIILSYLALGICVGTASLFSFFRTGTVTAQSGSGWEFNIMMAIVLGGFPMSGGEQSRLSSAIVGAVTVTLLSNGLMLWGLDNLLVSGVKGVLFVAIVALSYDRSAGKLVS